MEKENVQRMLIEYDIIAISETKTKLPVNLPGYVSYQSKVAGTAERGGMVVLVRNYLADNVYDIDTSIGDQIWLQLRNCKGVLFGFCYIPPCDSQYYSHDAFSAIHNKIRFNHMNKGYIVMGDMNERFGKAVRDLG